MVYGYEELMRGLDSSYYRRFVMRVTAYMLIILVQLTGCFGGSLMETKGEEQIKIAIHPTSGYSDVFYFVLSPCGELTVQLGTAFYDEELGAIVSIDENPFLRVSERRGVTQLSLSELEMIYGLADSIYEGDYGVSDFFRSVDGGWYVQMQYKGKITTQELFYEISPDVKAIVDVFVELSPIDVYMQSFS